MESSAWTAVYERREGGWVAWCAEQPGTGVSGFSLAEVRQSLSDLMKQLTHAHQPESQEAMVLG